MAPAFFKHVPRPLIHTLVLAALAFPYFDLRQSVNPTPAGKKLRGWRCLFFSLGILGLITGIALPAFAPQLLPEISLEDRLLHNMILLPASVILLFAGRDHHWNRCFFASAFSLWDPLAFAGLRYFPAIERFWPVRDFCRPIERQAAQGDQFGHYRASVPSMIFYPRKPVFEEFHPASMAARFRASSRIFCILDEQEYKYFLSRGDVSLHKLACRPHSVTRLRFPLNSENQTAHDMILASNRAATPATDKGAASLR